MYKNKLPKFNVRLSPENHKLYKKFCKENKTTLTKHASKLVEKFINKNLKILVLFFMIPVICQAQNDLKYAAYNVISSSLVSGIGSGFHHKKGEKFTHAMIKGLYKGAIGGAINYTAKYSVKQNDFLLTSRLIHSIGQSIIINGYNNKPITSNLYLTLYCFNFQASFHKISIKIDPAIIGYIAYLSFSKGYSFNIKQTLLTGSIVFISSHKPITEGLTVGQSLGNTITAFKNNDPYFKPLKYSNSDFKANLKHEFIHALQYTEFDLFTPNSNNKILNHLNINLNFLSTYAINDLVNGYSNNYFENEANHFSN